MVKEAGKKSVLILLAHPDLENSVANIALTGVVKDMSSVKVVNLYEQPYEPYDLDYFNKLVDHAGAVIFQFPFYWASAPSELKRWIDEVFTSMARTSMVKDKPLLVVTTTASEYGAYRSGGRNKFTIDELLRPYQLIADYSGMDWKTPVVIYGIGRPEGEMNLRIGIDMYRETIIGLLSD